MDQGLAIDRRRADHAVPVSERAATVAAAVVDVPDLDLVLTLEAEAIVALAMRVEVGNDHEAASGRADLNRRAMLFSELFDRWRQSQGLEEGGTWPAESHRVADRKWLDQRDVPPLFR